MPSPNGYPGCRAADDARQHRHLRHLCGDLRLERGDRRHRGRGGAAPISRSAATTSLCSSARWPPAARRGTPIPPSINFIIYGLITNTSVPRLYLAGMIPGLVLTSFFMLTVLIYCLASPRNGRTKIETDWGERIASLKDLLAPLFIFFVVVGSIYLGWVMPTEAASMGVFAALLLAAWERALSWRMLRFLFEGTMRTTAMIMLIIIAAQFLNFVLASIGLTDGIGKLIEGLGLGKYGTMVLIVIFYLILQAASWRPSP